MSDLGGAPGEAHLITAGGGAHDPGQWRPALPPCGAAVEQNHSGPSLSAECWRAMRRAAELEEAAAACRRAVDGHPLAAELHLRLADILERQGRTDEAEAAFLRAFVLDPMQSDPLNGLAGLGWPGPRVAELHAMFDGIGGGALPYSLRNPGVFVLNDAPAADTATIIVVGVPRSGTSMVAAVLDSLGVCLGSRPDRAVFEDFEIAAALELDPASLSDIIARHNAAHRVWGFKRPLAFQNIAASLHYFRNPRLIVTFRDVLAIAMRNAISMNAELLASLAATATLISDLTEFAQALKVPALMVSYEKALADPSRLVDSVLRFCGIAATTDQIEKAKDVVVNGPELYLQNSRVLPWEGCLDDVGEHASGWARLPSTERPVAVVIKLDGVEVGRGLANRPRSDLAFLGKGDVAFTIPLSQRPGPNATIEAYIDGTNYRLPRTQDIAKGAYHG